MAEAKVAEFYRCRAGLTVGMSVCQEGEVIEGSVFQFEGDHQPLSRADQIKKFGRVMYEPYEPDEEDMAAIRSESARIRGMNGMQHPDHPPVMAATDIAPANLHNLSLAELRAEGRQYKLKFPAEMARDRMIAAIEKKRAKGEQPTTGSEQKDAVLERHREAAEDTIAANNEALKQGTTKGATSRRRAAAAEPEEDEDEDETTEETTEEEEETE